MSETVAPAFVAESNGDDFIIVVRVPGYRPRRFVVQLRRYNSGEEYTITQTSEQLGKREADTLAQKWAKWHRLEVHGS